MDKEKIEARLDSYLEHCQYEKALNAHTLKAYGTSDLIRTTIEA